MKYLILFTIILFLGCYSPTENDKICVVKYEVNGSSKKADIKYYDDTRNKYKEVKGAKIPWQFSFSGYVNGTPAHLMAINRGNGTIIVNLYKDNSLVKTDTCSFDSCFVEVHAFF